MKITNDSDRLNKCTAETIAWLHDCHVLIQNGRPLQANPFYERAALLTPEVVSNVLGAIEGIFLKEFHEYASYHKTAQGISPGERLVPPRFLKLPYGEQLALVQGIDRIFQQYRAPDEKPPG